MDRFNQKLRDQLAAWDLSPGRVVVGLSGGPDSVALLRGMSAVAGSLGWELVAAHLNHQLRPTAQRDEQFVTDLCRRLGVPLEVASCDIAAEAAAQQTGLEETARQRRYRFLAEAAARSGAKFVAVAHTADDQVETVLHRLIRGTGIKGLRGIPSRRRLDRHCELIRPLLEFSRQEVLEYLGRIGQPYVIDETNSQLQATRNRIRHDLLRKIEAEYNPQVREALLRLARQAADVDETMRILSHGLLRKAVKQSEPAHCRLRARVLADQPRHLVRACLQELWRMQGWSEQEMGYAHWNRLADLVQGSKDAISLPGGVDARRREGWVVLTCPGQLPKAEVEHRTSSVER